MSDAVFQPSRTKPARRPVYTAAERARRDATRWTLVQGLLAPVQFLVFIVSAVLVVRYLATAEGYGVATASVVVKTLVLYAIMVTGAIWEKVVFGQYLLHPSFYWEDAVSFAVIALHTLYLVALFGGFMGPDALMWIALAAYGTYVVNAVQFIGKMRQARAEA